MTQPTIVFDLDGTLIDTAPDLVDTLNRVLQQERLEPVAFDEARSLIGGGARAMIERALRIQNRRCDLDEINRLYGIYVDHYSQRIAERSRPFPGLRPALDRLESEGCIFAVCTNKLEWLSVRLLDELGLSARFAAICGQDTFGVMKPDPEVLRQTVRRSGGDIARAVMVGDSVTDIRVARAAGVPVIAVDFGYTNIPVSELGPDRIIGHFDELRASVASLAGEGSVFRPNQAAATEN